ncbi:3-phosphoshikimate 1-carboxyvinyltransferase [Flavobacteriaceae sp. LMIT009]
MDIALQKSKIANQSFIKITGSKSESNRLLLLKSLFLNLSIENISNSDDSVLMTKALNSDSNLVDIHHAGTAMRFLTAYFSIQEGSEVVLTGSQRMQERPIKILVDALRDLGAEITYETNEGYPPIRIKGKKLTKNKVELAANVSSQYISALLLIASRLEQGLELTLNGQITSTPYIKMTLSLLEEVGVKTSFEGNTITIFTVEKVQSKTLVVESDWSSASYFYSIVALSEIGTEITLSAYKENSLQGDSVLVTIYKDMGVETKFHNNQITLTKSANCQLPSVNYDLTNAPDIAQTIAVTCVGLGVGCHLTGLHTLKIKETDRLVALKTEIEKFGTSVEITDKTLTIDKVSSYNSNVSVDTYHDHRMAMAFAPLALRIGFTINEADVVSKSYPDFWEDLQNIGFSFTQS